jgi:hypothetical protein
MVDNENDDFTTHGYSYYVGLLAIRKMWGPLAIAVLAKQFGRPQTNDEFVAEVQRHLGARGLLLARKGLAAAKSDNKHTDEHLVVTAVLPYDRPIAVSKIGSTSRDPDVLEQYVKVLHLIKEHYRSMLVADRYAANANAMPFREVPVQSEGKHVSPFSGGSVLELETTDLEFNPLSASFHFVISTAFSSPERARK